MAGGFVDKLPSFFPRQQRWDDRVQFIYQLTYAWAWSNCFAYSQLHVFVSTANGMICFRI